MAWLTPPNFVAGMTTGVAAALQKLSGDLAVLGGAWTVDARASTAIWTNTSAALGNGTLVSRYRQVGKTINWEVVLTFGSTTNAGSGQFTFALPVAGALNSPIPFPLYINDTSSAATFIGMAVINGTSVFLRHIAVASTLGTTSSVTTSSPMTWAVGDSLSFQVEWETA